MGIFLFFLLGESVEKSITALSDFSNLDLRSLISLFNLSFFSWLSLSILMDFWRSSWTLFLSISLRLLSSSIFCTIFFLYSAHSFSCDSNRVFSAWTASEIIPSALVLMASILFLPWASILSISVFFFLSLDTRFWTSFLAVSRSFSRMALSLDSVFLSDSKEEILVWKVFSQLIHSSSFFLWSFSLFTLSDLKNSIWSWALLSCFSISFFESKSLLFSDSRSTPLFWASTTIWAILVLSVFLCVFSLKSSKTSVGLRLMMSPSWSLNVMGATIKDRTFLRKPSFIEPIMESKASVAHFILISS